jgi:integrase
MIERTRSGKVRARVFINGQRRTVATCATEEEARTEAARARAILDKQGGQTLAAFGWDWFDERELDGVRGVEHERNRWKTHVEGSPLGGMAPERISSEDVIAWVRHLEKKRTATPHHKTTRPLGPKTIREVLGLVRLALDAAGVVPNPAAEAKGALKRATKRRGVAATEEPWTYLEPEDQRAILDCARAPEAVRLIVAFAILTGLRQGEQMNLELRDVRLKDEAPHVVVRFGSRGQPPKNGKIRRVYLSAEALRVTERWLEVLPTWLDGAKNEHGLAFPTAGGSRCATGKTPLLGSLWDPAKKKSVKVDCFRSLLALAGVKRSVRWHDLRHTCASSLVAGWWGRRWSLEEAREHLGHTSIASTQRYAHLGESAIKQAVAETSGRALPSARGGSRSQERNVPSAWNRWVGRQGLEPWTYGLKEPPEAVILRALVAAGGQGGGQVADRARAALAAHAAGDPFAAAMLVRLLEELVSAEGIEAEPARVTTHPKTA